MAALDSACGCAALSLMAPATRVLTVELKVNLLSPAVGNFLLARGKVVRPGRNLAICRGDGHDAGHHDRCRGREFLASRSPRKINCE
jgi:acyl-coenzyme A thioesterase PaaI-like protein